MRPGTVKTCWFSIVPGRDLSGGASALQMTYYVYILSFFSKKSQGAKSAGFSAVYISDSSAAMRSVMQKSCMAEAREGMSG